MDALVDIPAADLELLKPPWGELGRACVLGSVSGVAKLLLKCLNTMRVQDSAGNWETAVTQRPQGVGLVTIANHTRQVPGVLGMMVNSRRRSLGARC
jgi:hypothetical protein